MRSVINDSHLLLSDTRLKASLTGKDSGGDYMFLPIIVFFRETIIGMGDARCRMKDARRRSFRIVVSQKNLTGKKAVGYWKCLQETCDHVLAQTERHLIEKRDLWVMM